MTADVSELLQLAADLRAAPERIERSAERVGKRGALEVKKGMQQDFTGHRYAPRVPGSLEFEDTAVGALAWRIGELDSAGPQWGLAAILAFGTSNNAPVVDHARALETEAPQVERYLGDAGANELLGGAR